MTKLQRKIDDIGVMFYTYVGIIQRDAPPAARPPDEADEIPNDAAMVKKLTENTPEYAKDIGLLLRFPPVPRTTAAQADFRQPLQ